MCSGRFALIAHRLPLKAVSVAMFFPSLGAGVFSPFAPRSVKFKPQGVCVVVVACAPF